MPRSAPNNHFEPWLEPGVLAELLAEAVPQQQEAVKEAGPQVQAQEQPLEEPEVFEPEAPVLPLQRALHALPAVYRELPEQLALEHLLQRRRSHENLFPGGLSLPEPAEGRELRPLALPAQPHQREPAGQVLAAAQPEAAELQQ